MFRYLALIWDPCEPTLSETVRMLARHPYLRSPRWTEVTNHKGLQLFCSDARQSLGCRLLSNDYGVVLGTLFRRHAELDDDTPCPEAQLNIQDCTATLNTQGRWLLEKCWGNYVAFLRDPSSNVKWIIRDPTSTIHCFYTSFQNVTIVFSCVADCMGIELPRFTINPDYLAAYVVARSYAQRNPLNEVSQVHRGECIEFDYSRWSTMSRRFYWRPGSFSKADSIIEDTARAARAMRATVRACTHSWASCHGSVLHRLSGGLDSSIISGCLKDAPTRPRVTSYTHYHPEGRSDERPWARLAAEYAGYEHHERAITPESLGMAAMSQMQPSVEPASALGFLHRRILELPLAHARHATAVFSGDGGDSGFCSDSITYAVSEYLGRHGFHPHAFQLAFQVAQHTQLSTLSILAQAVHHRLTNADRGFQQYILDTICRLVTPELTEKFRLERNSTHPWFCSETRIPRALIRQVGALLYPPDSYSTEPDGWVPEIISPLYSQPAIELFLRIPVYVHFAGGVNRGLARMAFAQDVPQAILRRLWKDRVPRFHDEVIRRNLDFLRTTFLDGILVRHGVLDRTAVEQAFLSTPTKRQVQSAEIFRHLDTELWARQWAGAESDASLTNEVNGARSIWSEAL